MEDKESRADLRYYPANACKPLVDIADRYVKTQTDRELTLKIIDRLIEETN